MIPIRRELLRPAGVLRLRICATNIAADNLSVRVKFFERPFEIVHRKATVFPIGYRCVGAKTIEVDRDVNVHAAQIRGELFESFPPIFAQDSVRKLSTFHRAVARPGMNFEASFAFGAAIPENVVRPPVFKIPQTPNRDMLDMRKLERAIDPTTAGPARRRDRPVRMIVE